MPPAEEAAATAAVSPGEHTLEEETTTTSWPSLQIPLASSSNGNFIEVFPEELPETPAATLLPILKDEQASLDVWADVALGYIRSNSSTSAAAILQAGCDKKSSDNDNVDDNTKLVRLWASAGICHLAQHWQSSSSNEKEDDWIALADAKFTHSSKLDNLYPMTWMGKGLLNVVLGRKEQAHFFLETTLKQCGRILPALLGLAAVHALDHNYKAAQDLYGEAMRLDNVVATSAASTRVGFGMASYQLGQVRKHE